MKKIYIPISLEDIESQQKTGAHKHKGFIP